MLAVLRFLREYTRSRPSRVVRSEVHYARGPDRLPASIYAPAAARRPLPAFVVLHGLTCTGREHASLTRFVRAMAASGAVVMIPEIPEWRELRVAPAVTIPTIRAAVHALAHRGDVAPGGVGILGFSFGATQALVAAAGGELMGEVRGIAAWGGYRDVHRLFRFGVTGEHEWAGTRLRLEPDPYGRWIMVGNYLTGVPGYEDAGATARASHALALEAGRTGVAAWDPELDDLKRRLRLELPTAERALFDIVAPPARASAPPAEAAALAAGLADAALTADPLLDPGPALGELATPTLLAHGRDDRLIPYTEMLRLAADLPENVRRGATVTALFAHSGGARPGLGPLGLATEAVRFVDLLRHILERL